MVCSLPLQYHTQAVDGICHYCGNSDKWYISCSDGHMVCDSCHNQQTMQQIEAIILKTTSIDPFSIAEQCMDLAILPMLGCQHAYIAGGALMAALKNEGTYALTKDAVHELFHRTAKQSHGGYCGLTGTCGIAPALGACVAILTSSKCGLDREQRLTMELVARVVRAITELTGPSCCKAYVRTSLAVGVEVLQQNFSVFLPGKDNTACKHVENHPHGCRKEKCPYFLVN
jgi:hypothetical protein